MKIGNLILSEQRHCSRKNGNIKRSSKSRHLLFVALLLIISACQSQVTQTAMVPIRVSVDSIFIPNRHEKAEALDAYFKKLCSNGRFNGSMLIAIRGKIVYENCFGYTNFQKKQTVDISSRFQIGSASKSFTAVAVMLLKDRGLIDYDALLTKYIPEFPYPSITVRMLLSHRSGLSNYLYFTETMTDRTTIITNEDVLKLMIQHHPEPYYPPNHGFHYCNTNYILLALLVERVSKMPFKDFMRTQVFKPLEMDSTFIFDPFAKETLKNVTTGYHFKWSEALHVYHDGVTGDKNVYTTLHDMLRWDQAFYTAKLLKPETIAEALRPSSPERRGVKNYGFGFRLLKMEDDYFVPYHGGWWRGFNALFMRLIKDKTTIIIFSNVRTNSALAYSEIWDILEPKREKNDITIEESSGKKE